VVYRPATHPVNVGVLVGGFGGGGVVAPDSLREAGLATRRGLPVKILGHGELSKALTVRAHGFSKTARERIEAAGGTCAIIED